MQYEVIVYLLNFEMSTSDVFWLCVLCKQRGRCVPTFSLLFAEDFKLQRKSSAKMV